MGLGFLMMDDTFDFSDTLLDALLIRF